MSLICECRIDLYFKKEDFTGYLHMSFTVPFNFANREPYLGKGFFYIPPHYSHHSEQDLPLSEIAEGKKIFVELCSGNGEWIAEKAKSYPHIQWIAVEKRFDRAKKIWKKASDLSNLFVILGDGLTFFRSYLPDRSLSKVYINFPDPWPKKKHAKHRLLDLPLKKELERVLLPYSTITMVTDDPSYRDHAIDLFYRSWKSEFPFPNYIKKWEGYGSSFFRRLWESKDKQSFFLSFLFEGKND